MADEPVTLEFIAWRLDRIQTEQGELRRIAGNTAADITVLTELVLKLARDGVQIKEMLGRLEGRISRIEPTGTAS
jgi:hypothetical protein